LFELRCVSVLFVQASIAAPRERRGCSGLGMRVVATHAFTLTAQHMFQGCLGVKLRLRLLLPLLTLL
jgi:hypothetical protein